MHWPFKCPRLLLFAPASIGMVLIARLLVAAIYLGGRVSLADVDRAAWATRCFCAGIWAFEAQLILLRVFYAMRDVKTPMRVSLWMVLLNFSLNLTLVWYMQVGGLAASTTIAAIVQTAILVWILRRRLGPLGLRAFGPLAAKTLVASAVMALVAAGVNFGLAHLAWCNYQHRLGLIFFRLPAVVGAAAVAYIGMAAVLRTPELAGAPFVGRIFAKYVQPHVAEKTHGSD